MSQKELKQPDAFQKAGAEAGGWLQTHGKLVVTVAAVAVMGGAGVAVANYVGVRGETKAAMALSTALEALNAPVVSDDSTLKADANEMSFKSDAEKNEALVKSLLDFRGQYPNSRSAVTASFLLGQAHYRLNKFDEALTEFDTYLKAAPADDIMKSTALEMKGYIYEGQGKWDEALAAFDTLASENKSEFMNGMGAYHRARILILQNKKDEAAKLLSTIPATTPNTTAARLATERMAVLTSQGVVVPPPAPATPLAPAADAG